MLALNVEHLSVQSRAKRGAQLHASVLMLPPSAAHQE